MELILVRHPAVAIEPGICYGQSDIPLAEPAESFATDLVGRLGRLTDALPQWIDTSPLIRCASVAVTLADHYGLPLREHADLMELDYGGWEMARWDTVDRAQLDAWAANLEQGRPHGGESAAMLAVRVDRWLAGAEAVCPPSSSILALTHAGVIRMLASRLLGEPIAVSLRRPLAYGAICRFVRTSEAEAGTAAGAAPRDRDPGHGDASRWKLHDWNI
jgi:alpha-ribazole phosphatase